MHGCGSGNALLVNAEVDSMGGVVDGGVGIGLKTSPRRAAIEKAQAELRQEYDVREERRRELEFLEKGGNPLDFRFGNTASVSVQSTSLTDQQAEHFVTSEAKDSFALTASPHGDSVESSGRPGVPTACEPNSADNLLLFDGQNDLLEGERNSKHPVKRKGFVPSEQSSQMDGIPNAKESEDSAIFRPYARRNRSRINRDAARSSSNDVVQSRTGHGSSVTARGGSRDVKGPKSDSNNKKDQSIPPVCNSKLATSNGDIVSKIVNSDNQSKLELDNSQIGPEGNMPEHNLDGTVSKSLSDDQYGQSSQVVIRCTPVDMNPNPDLGGCNEEVAGVQCPPNAAAQRNENGSFCDEQNGSGGQDRDGKSVPNEVQNSSAAVVGAKGLDSESSCTQNSISAEANNDLDAGIHPKYADSNGTHLEQASESEGTKDLAAGEMVKDKNGVKPVDCGAAINDVHAVSQNHRDIVTVAKDEEEINKTGPDLPHDVACPSGIAGLQSNDRPVLEFDKDIDVRGDGTISDKEKLCSGRSQGTTDVSTIPGKNSADVPDVQTESSNHSKLADKAHEDSILEEARMIEAKRKRIAELSVGTLSIETRGKSQWDFVLEEMAWLANDFAQERLWKMTAAAQICHRVSFSSRLRAEELKQRSEVKKVALTLAKAVMQFWQSAEMLLKSDDPEKCRMDLDGSGGNEVSESRIGVLHKDTSKELKHQSPRKSVAVIEGYAVRFLKHIRSPVPPLQAEAPATPDRISDLGIMEVSWDDHLTEESLFYAVPSGAMETYRKSIESHLAQCEKIGSGMQEEVDTSHYDVAAEYGYHDSAYDEDEEETSTYYLSGSLGGSKPSKFIQKKRKNTMKSCISRSYDPGADMPYAHGTMGSQQSMFVVKRSVSSLNVGTIPTKRMRTASRQRVIGPFGGGGAGNLQAPAKTDASSGDTSSFQDDQSTLHGGSQIQKSGEVESVGEFEKQLPYDCAETSTRPKKKKKAKHMGSSYEQGWQVDSTVYGQRDNSKKRLENHLFDSNAASGLYVQPKKPKLIRQAMDTNFDNISPMSGSIPSPAASQMSNMSNPTKFIKFIGGRDRGRKTKTLKVSSGQPGPGSPWSLFEDQALVVLVHDMGPNWELVSDAINSTLQFKCIFRKPKECKERHKILMDRGAGDGADSAEDSGSSQSYPSTLPGIPKGSARQLFQRLQGPMEEDTIKSHFEKIIVMGKKHHFRKNQNVNQDPRQIVPVHNSHVIALSQVCPNNLNGGILTPHDLCDVSTLSPDALPVGYPGFHASGLTIANQGAVPPMLPASGPNSSLQGSSGMVLGSNMSSSSGALNANVRDGRYNVPRTSLPVDEQQRMQHYNQMLPGRNIQQSNLSAAGALSGPERGARMLPGGSGMGMMCGINRSMPIPRPGYQGMASSPMLNSGSMLSSSMVGMPSAVNMHPGAGSGQGNSMLRPREAMHMMRPGHNPDHQRQLMVPEMQQMQVAQGNGQGHSTFNGLTSAFSNQTTSPAQTFPGHPQQQHQVSPQQSHGLSNHHPHLTNHATGSQQQAYAIRLAKERQLQQRYLQQQQQQQQQQFASSGAMMPHAQPQGHSSQIQSQNSSQATSTPTSISLQHQQKHTLPSHALSRNPQAGGSGLNSQMGKQRPRQPQSQQQLQQPGRHHLQQRPHAQSHQQAKLLKGVGRGNIVLHQNLTVDPSHLNGLTPAPGNQATEKGDQIVHVMPGQGMYSGSGTKPVQPSKPLVPPQASNHSQPHQKLYSGSTPPSSKHLQQMPSRNDSSTQGQVPPVPSNHALSTTNQPCSPVVMAPKHQHPQLQGQLHQKQSNQTQTQQTVQRMLQQKQVNIDQPSKSQTDETQGEQQPVNGASAVSSTTTPAVSQVSVSSANFVPASSSAVVSQWKTSEPVYDSGIPHTPNKVGSNVTLPNSAGTDAVNPVSKGLGQKQLSGSFQSHGPNVGAQWHQQLQSQQSPPQPSVSQQQCQPQDQQLQNEQQQQLSHQQLPPQQQPQQQGQHLQGAKGNLYIKSTNTNLD